jgi:hypothetical protein
VHARAISITGAPSNPIRRYDNAYACVRADAPITSTIHGANASPTIVNDAPSATASQTPATPCSAAERSSPAPTRRATAAVVP